MWEDPANWLALLSGPTQWFLGHSTNVALLVIGVLLMIEMIIWGAFLAKVRFSPLWVLLLAAPYLYPSMVTASLLIIAFWILAFKRWPIEKQATDDSAG